MPKLILEVDLPDADSEDDPEQLADEILNGELPAAEIISAEWA